MVPVFISARGTRVPGILYGTAWKAERTASLVAQAIGLGFRGIDTACQPKHYAEAGVGEGVTAALERGLRREQLHLQTKFSPPGTQDPRSIPYDPRASLSEQVRQSARVSLENLRTPYLDALVLHSPLPRMEQTLEAWRAMERLVEEGVVRELGISNCYELPALDWLWQRAEVRPSILQNRFYRQTGYDRELRAFCREQGVSYQSFWTLTANPHILAHPRVRRLAAQYGATPEQTLFRCLTQARITPLTGTTSEQHMREDLAIFDFELSEAEHVELMALFG